MGIKNYRKLDLTYDFLSVKGYSSANTKFYTLNKFFYDSSKESPDPNPGSSSSHGSDKPLPPRPVDPDHPSNWSTRSIVIICIATAILLALMFSFAFIACKYKKIVEKNREKSEIDDSTAGEYSQIEDGNVTKSEQKSRVKAAHSWSNPSTRDSFGGSIISIESGAGAYYSGDHDQDEDQLNALNNL